MARKKKGNSKKLSKMTKKKFKDSLRKSEARQIQGKKYRLHEVHLLSMNAQQEGKRLKRKGYINFYRVKGPNKYGHYKLWVR